MQRLLVFLVCVLAASVLAAGIPVSRAAGTVDNTAGDPVVIPDLQAGWLLFKAGQLQQAHELLERTQPADDAGRTERLFLLGLVEVQLGLLRQAARRFEVILAQQPKLTRVRLELAQVYHALGRDEKARFHFEASLADELPASVETVVEDFLNRIDVRKRWSASFSAAVLPETNPARRSDSPEVLISGIPFQLDQQKSSGVGLLVSAGAAFSPMISDDLRGVLTASTTAKLYRQQDWNDVSVRGEAGLVRLFDGGMLSGGLRVGRRWLDGDLYNREIGPWLRGRLRLSAVSRLHMNMSAGNHKHPGLHRQDGWRISVSPGLIHALNARTSIETDLDLERVGAREDYYTSRLVGLGVTLRRAFRGGLSIAPGLSVHVRRYAGLDPLFQQTRTDRLLRVSVNLLHRALQYEGFAPYVEYSFESNRSSIPLRTYRNHGIMVGISKKF